MSFVIPTQRALRAMARIAKEEGVELVVDLSSGEMRLSPPSSAEPQSDGGSPYVDKWKRGQKSARRKAGRPKAA